MPETFASVNTAEGEVITISLPRCADLARSWAAIARNRARWSSDPFAYEELARRIRMDLDEFGIRDEELRRMAEASLVEVSTAPVEGALGFAGAAAPWEYLIASATRFARPNRPISVVRHLQAADAERRMRPEQLLIVISGPGAIAEYYSFESEARLIRTSFGTGKLLKNPTIEELSRHVASLEPDVIHVTGVDIHQGSTLLGYTTDPYPPEQEGIYLRDEVGSPVAVDADSIARAVTAARRKPLFVGYNFYNASSIAARTVHHGAASAVGFHDTFDDRLAEVFFSEFYAAFRKLDGDAHKTFEKVWRTIRLESRDVLGAAVVLWSAKTIGPVQTVPAVVAPAVSAAEEPPPRTDRRRRRRVPEPVQPQAAAPVLIEPPQPVPEPPPAAPAVPTELVAEPAEPERPCEAVVRERKTVNYSLLHNRRGLFDRFELKKHVAEPLDDVLIEVTLLVSDKKYEFRRTVRLEEPVTDLRADIYVPLTWITNLRLFESVLTNVDVLVKIGEEIIFQRPFQVTLLPPDEWTDDDVNRQWLPSFVLPRDPAVSQIIGAAEKLLPALADRSDASFDGYQSLGRDPEDPFGGVDTQVQSIWAALALHTPLRYVNPPPTYTLASQRVRTPSQVLAGNRGTCIDLALLLASCFEFIEVYPVLFLLRGHAFAGYWRSDRQHKDFLKLAPDPDPSPEEASWMIRNAGYAHVMAQIRGGALVPLEATLLTQRGGFTEAIEEGFMNLRSSDEFEALIDISLARERDVRPLPIADFL